MKKRQIKKYGNSFVIRLSPTDMDDLELSEEDFVDIGDICKIKGGEKDVRRINKRKDTENI